MKLIAFLPSESRSGDEPVGDDGGHLTRLREVDAGCLAVLEGASHILALFGQVSVQSSEKRQRQCPQETGKTTVLTIFHLLYPLHDGFCAETKQRRHNGQLLEQSHKMR